MHIDHLEAIHLVNDLGLRLGTELTSEVEVALHPPFTDLRTVQSVVQERGWPVSLGAQHCSDKDKGAYTGEVSAAMLARLETRYVLVGHSERRHLFAMTDEVVASTLAAVLGQGMVPVCCVGETAEERDADATAERLEGQLRAALAKRNADEIGGLVVAYEPVWAIGTGRAAGADDAQAACHTLRAVLADLAGPASEETRILYGGSVSPDNAAELVSEPDVDGLLVGSASLTAATFSDIIQAVAGCYRAG